MGGKWLKIVYGACFVQFALTFIYITTFCQPLTKSHMALVGLSAVCGLLLSGIIRRGYKDFKKSHDKSAAYKDLKKNLQKIREQNSKITNL